MGYPSDVDDADKIRLWQDENCVLSWHEIVFLSPYS